METRAYRSKIGRLPHALRTELNERLRDGATGKAICRWLNDLPEAAAIFADAGGPLNDENIHKWRNAGYKDWLADQQKLSHLRAQAELARDMASVVGGDPLAIGTRFLAGKLMDCMAAATDEDVGALAKAVAALRQGETAAARAKLLGEKVATDRERLDLDRERFRFQVAERALAIFEDRAAAAIAAGAGSHDDKIKRLLEYMDRKEKEGSAQ
jgi:hypothetical protein